MIVIGLICLLENMKFSLFGLPTSPLVVLSVVVLAIIGLEVKCTLTCGLCKSNPGLEF